MAAAEIIDAGIIVIHASAGVTGIAAGLGALLVRKGARLHRAAGTVFMIAMPVNAITAAALGVRNEDPADIMGGVLTFYLVTTAWAAARRRSRRAGVAEWAAFLSAAALATLAALYTQNAIAEGTAVHGGYVFAFVVGFAALLDLSVILRGGVAGKQRIMRHVWRVHLGLFIAIGSFFPGQLQIFPEYVQRLEPKILLFTPALLVIASMAAWLCWTLTAAPSRRD